MEKRAYLPILVGVLLVFLAIVLAACGDATAPPSEATAPPEVASTEAPTEVGAAAYAVDLIAAWVDAGAPETDAFDYTGVDDNTYQATFEADILPLFTTNGAWFEARRPARVVTLPPARIHTTRWI